MTGVLLVNMGGATSQKEMKLFLSRMFRDPFILPMGKTVRNLLATLISNSRYKKSWKKYVQIGGTPIINATSRTVNALQNELPSDYSVRMAFSYSSPLIRESVEAFYKDGIRDIKVIPLYPQYSYATTSSVISDCKRSVAGFKDMKVGFVEAFHQQEGFVMFWAKNIHEHISNQKHCSPYLIFSAHSIPEEIHSKDSTYVRSIADCSKIIAEKLRLDYEVAYQSGMRRGKWIGPDIKERLKVLAASGINDIVMVPVSFVNENLETLYDMDIDIIPFAQQLGIKKISRVKIPEADPLFIRLLADIVKS